MKRNKSEYCLNCGTKIDDSDYCYNCGQLNTDKRFSVKQLADDFFNEIFTWDSKFLKSLWALLFKPAFLTKEYLAGRRSSYVVPLRFYIIASFLFFLTLNILSKFEEKEDQQINSTVLKDSLRRVFEGENFTQEELREKTFQIIDSLYSGEINIAENLWQSNDSTATPENNGFVKFLKKKLNHFNQKDGGKMLKKSAIEQIPTLMFILMPIFALILKLLFMRHSIYYIEHLIYTLHLHTFIFFLSILLVISSNSYIDTFALWAIPLYIFLSFYRFYRNSIRKTLFKLFLLFFIYLTALIPAMVLLLFLAVLNT